MPRTKRDVISSFDDSQEIAEALHHWAHWAWDDAKKGDLSYWLAEASVHIEGLYKEACRMQRKIARLEAKLAQAKAAAPEIA